MTKYDVKKYRVQEILTLYHQQLMENRIHQKVA
jgi:hypothetical protein